MKVEISLCETDDKYLEIIIPGKSVNHVIYVEKDCVVYVTENGVRIEA
jgi:hypothetical protein